MQKPASEVKEEIKAAPKAALKVAAEAVPVMIKTTTPKKPTPASKMQSPDNRKADYKTPQKSDEKGTLSQQQLATPVEPPEPVKEAERTPKVRSKFLAGTNGASQRSDTKRALSNVSGSYRGMSASNHFSMSGSRIGMNK